MAFDNFCKVYGLDPEIAGKIPCPPIENEQIQIKIQMVNWCEHMKRMIDTIENSFIKAPVDKDVKRTHIMKKCQHYMKRAVFDAELVMATMNGRDNDE